MPGDHDWHGERFREIPAIVVQPGIPSICHNTAQGGSINHVTICAGESGMRVSRTNTEYGREIWVCSCSYANMVLLPKVQQVQYFLIQSSVYRWSSVILLLIFHLLMILTSHLTFTLPINFSKFIIMIKEKNEIEKNQLPYKSGHCNIGLVWGEVRRIRKVNFISESLFYSVFVASIRGCWWLPVICHGAADGRFHGKAAELQTGQEGIRAIINFLFHCVLHQWPYFSKDEILSSYPVAFRLSKVNEYFHLCWQYKTDKNGIALV